MSALLIAPYNLLRGDAIYAIVTATNARGESVASPNNPAGITVETVPDQMTSPTRLSTSTDTRFELSWTALSAPPATPSNGGSTILSYFLEWDSGTNGATWS